MKIELDFTAFPPKASEKFGNWTELDGNNYKIVYAPNLIGAKFNVQAIFIFNMTDDQV